jgi:hypothetical protein
VHAPMSEPINIELLIKLMMMTTSATDGEALAAVRFANTLLSKHGGNWDELLRGKLAPIDPFASLPEPPQAAKPTTPTPQPQRPPPPPVYFGLDKVEAKKITNWLVLLEFATLDSATTRQVNHIEQRWRANKQLNQFDFDFLKTTAAKVNRKRP